MRLKDSEKEWILRLWIKSNNPQVKMTTLAERNGLRHKTFIRVVKRYEAYLNACQRDADLIELKLNL